MITISEGRNALPILRTGVRGVPFSVVLRNFLRAFGLFYGMLFLLSTVPTILVIAFGQDRTDLPSHLGVAVISMIMWGMAWPVSATLSAFIMRAVRLHREKTSDAGLSMKTYLIMSMALLVLSGVAWLWSYLNLMEIVFG